MQTLQGITGPGVSFQAGQVGGPIAGFQPGQVSGPGAYIPYQTNDWTSMFSAMMPMIMMIMMMAILVPMMKGMTESAK